MLNLVHFTATVSRTTLTLCLAVALLSVPAATMTGPAAEARSAHHASPRALVLRSSDLSSGFRTTMRHADPVAPPAGMPGAPSIVSAYEIAFSGPARPGLWTVDNAVSEFRSAKAARSDLARVIPYLRQTNVGRRCRSFTASGVGAARSDYLCDLAGEGGRLTSGAI